MGIARQRIATLDRLMMLLPLLMWIAAAIISWVLVNQLLVRPLKKLERSVLAYSAGEGPLELPRKLGPSREIRELRSAFTRAISQVEKSERGTTLALEGQRRLVREVHHRVKNNLQVIASLLNITAGAQRRPRRARPMLGSAAASALVHRPSQPFRRDGRIAEFRCVRW